MESGKVFFDEHEGYAPRINNAFFNLIAIEPQKTAELSGMTVQELKSFKSFNDFLKVFVPPTPIVPPKVAFPQHEQVLGIFDIIKSEFMELIRNNVRLPELHETDAEQTSVSAYDGIPWRVFTLKIFGNTIESNCELCPLTSRFFEPLKDVKSVMFSVIEGGKHIPLHTGTTSALHRYHIPLIVPPGNGNYIEIEGTRHHWKEGESFVFLDSCAHEVWNMSPDIRVNIFFDIVRNDLPPNIKAIAHAVMNGVQKNIGAQIEAKKLNYEVARRPATQASLTQ